MEAAGVILGLVFIPGIAGGAVGCGEFAGSAASNCLIFAWSSAICCLRAASLCDWDGDAIADAQRRLIVSVMTESNLGRLSVDGWIFIGCFLVNWSVDALGEAPSWVKR